MEFHICPMHQLVSAKPRIHDVYFCKISLLPQSMLINPVGVDAQHRYLQQRRLSLLIVAVHGDRKRACRYMDEPGHLATTLVVLLVSDTNP